MKTLFFDCFAGASGNMILGALVALGADPDRLRSELAKLGLPDFGIEFETRDKSGIAALHADVRVPDEKAHRHLRQIEEIIMSSALSDAVRERALGIFRSLAAAEAKVHGIGIEKVHFHEIGALDAIIDIVGACICFEELGIDRFAASKLHVGSGFVEMAHGRFPVPPPAVAEILRNAPVYSTEIAGELMTPTGAAIIAGVCDSFGPMPALRFGRVAYGAGTRDYDGFPNVLRLMLAEGGDAPNAMKLVLIETNLDDITAQTLGYVMERAFEAGALDCWFTPIQMKKNRPATMLSVLCDPARREELAALLYRETTTLGLRFSELDRECLERRIRRFETKLGAVDVKIAELRGRIINAKPEFEQLRRIAVERGIPLREAEARIIKEITEDI
jgi:hypothetical protein